MAHMWHRGVLNASSWHGLEEVGTFTDAASAIAHGERSGAWPVSLRAAELRTVDGLRAPCHAIVADYAAHPSAVVGVNGARYRATACDEWRDLVKAAVAAGAKPTGAFALCDGSRTLATFDIGSSNGIRTQFLIADAFDGSIKLRCGSTSVRVVCANTLAAAFQNDGSGMAGLTHTASLETKVNVLAESIGHAIKSGEKMKDVFNRAEDTYMSAELAKKAFDALFPPAADDASPKAKARAENVREDARRAAAMAINKVGDKPSNLATLWNAATFLVDRNADGSARKHGESDSLNSMLFGSRGKRIAEIYETIEVIMRDGSVERMRPHEAVIAGCDAQSVGRTILEEIMNG